MCGHHGRQLVAWLAVRGVVFGGTATHTGGGSSWSPSSSLPSVAANAFTSAKPMGMHGLADDALADLTRTVTLASLRDSAGRLDPAGALVE
jgi:hypothetical protein